MTEKAMTETIAPLSVPIIRKHRDKEGKIIKEEEINELTLHRIKLKAFQHMTAIEAELPLKTHLIAASAQLPLETVEEIDLVDIDIILEKMTPFLPRSLKSQ
jgi:hypothetical protein